MSGVNKFQRLTKIEFPLAFPHMMLGINQTIVFALFMVIIGAPIMTINKANTIVWFIPSIICGKANGNSILVNLWNLLTPDIVAA